jgi:hypothetical protein
VGVAVAECSETLTPTLLERMDWQREVSRRISSRMSLSHGPDDASEGDDSSGVVLLILIALCSICNQSSQKRSEGKPLRLEAVEKERTVFGALMSFLTT